MNRRQQGMQLLSILVGWSLALLTSNSPCRADDADWKAGLARVKVTPTQPVALSGYANRVKPFEKVEQDIYVKALALEDAHGNKGVIVTSDLIGYAAAIAEPICERIKQRTGLAREQILLNSSHTHAGPALELTPGESGESQRTAEYTRLLMDQTVDVVASALADLKPARLSVGSGVAYFVMNRREFTPRGVILGVNPRGPTDRSVPVLRIETPEGQLRGILFGAGTHGTTLGGDNYRLCGDYAGFAQSYLEEKFPNVQAMFMLGCAGDSNPYPRGTMEITREHGVSLGTEVARVLTTKLRPLRGPLQMAFAQTSLPLQGAISREEVEKRATGKTLYHTSAAQQMLQLLNKGFSPPTQYTCPIAVWQFGEDLTLVALPGEVVVDYVTLVEKAIGPLNLWVIGYSNDVFGYLPTARILDEGGYETRGLWTGSIGYFTPQAQDVVIKQVRDLAAKVGRQVSTAAR